MTRSLGRDRTIALALLAAAALTVPACTHDFASFDPAGSDVGENDGGADAPLTIGDGSRPDVATALDAADAAVAACANAPACGATSKTCSAMCDQARDTCRSNCGGSNSCKRKCDDDRDACEKKCVDTCQQCAGSACSSACN